MYGIDANLFMNWVLGLTLGVGALVFGITLGLAAFGGKNTGRVMSYLYMLSALFGVFAVCVVILGFRGEKSGERPWHVFLDMKYQPKYESQGESQFFADGRANRLPPIDTIPFDGTNYIADAGRHTNPNADFLRADPRYFAGIANPDMKGDDGGPAKPQWKDGQLAGEGQFVNHIPEEAVRRAGGWEPLLKRGRYQFNVHCAVCHGESGRGGTGDAAYGTVGLYGLSIPPANLVLPTFQAQADGEIYNTIANGKGSMSAYGHQIPVQDRWAIVAHVRVLQYSAGNPTAGN